MNSLKDLSQALGVTPEALLFAIRSDQGRLIIRLLEHFEKQIKASYLAVPPSKENLDRLIEAYGAARILKEIIETIRSLGGPNA